MRPFYVFLNSSNRKHTIGMGPVGRPGWFNAHFHAELGGRSKRLLSVESLKPISDTRTLLISVPGLGTIVLDAIKRTWTINLDDGRVLEGRMVI